MIDRVLLLLDNQKMDESMYMRKRDGGKKMASSLFVFMTTYDIDDRRPMEFATTQMYIRNENT